MKCVYRIRCGIFRPLRDVRGRNGMRGCAADHCAWSVLLMIRPIRRHMMLPQGLTIHSPARRCPGSGCAALCDNHDLDFTSSNRRSQLYHSMRLQAATLPPVFCIVIARACEDAASTASPPVHPKHHNSTLHDAPISSLTQICMMPGIVNYGRRCTFGVHFYR